MARNTKLPIVANCEHRAEIPKLVEMVRIERTDRSKVLTRREPLASAVDAYKHFDKREAGWIKTILTLLSEANTAPD